MRADVQKQNFLIWKEDKFNPIRIVYPQGPNAGIFAGELMRLEDGIERIGSENHFPFFCTVLDLLRKLAIILLKTFRSLNIHH